MTTDVTQEPGLDAAGLEKATAQARIGFGHVGRRENFKDYAARIVRAYEAHRSGAGEPKIYARGLKAAIKAMDSFASYDTPTTLAEDCISAYLSALASPAKAGELEELRREKKRAVDLLLEIEDRAEASEARARRMEEALRDVRQHEVQALHAGISRRDWHSTETAANQLRDRIDAALSDGPASAAPKPSEFRKSRPDLDFNNPDHHAAIGFAYGTASAARPAVTSEPVAWRCRKDGSDSWWFMLSPPRDHSEWVEIQCLVPQTSPASINGTQGEAEAAIPTQAQLNQAFYVDVCNAERRIKQLMELGTKLLDSLPSHWHDEANIEFRDLITDTEAVLRPGSHPAYRTEQATRDYYGSALYEASLLSASLASPAKAGELEELRRERPAVTDALRQIADVTEYYDSTGLLQFKPKLTADKMQSLAFRALEAASMNGTQGEGQC